MKLKFFICIFVIVQIKTELITTKFRVNRKKGKQNNLNDLQKNLERKLEINPEAEENYQEAFDNHQEVEDQIPNLFSLPTAVQVGSAVAAYYNLKRSKQAMVKKIHFLEQKEKLGLQEIILQTNQLNSSAEMLKQKLSQMESTFNRFKNRTCKALEDLKKSRSKKL